jgi:hypothetical protein
MLTEAERRLEPNRLLAYLYTQLDPLTRMPRRLGHVLSELEQGSLKIGVVHRFEWLALAGFCLAALIGLYMLWKIIRTPGEL